MSHFEFFQEMDGFLLEQEAQLAEQKKWLEHDLEGSDDTIVHEVQDDL